MGGGGGRQKEAFASQVQGLFYHQRPDEQGDFIIEGKAPVYEILGVAEGVSEAKFLSIGYPLYR